MREPRGYDERGVSEYDARQERLEAADLSAKLEDAEDHIADLESDLAAERKEVERLTDIANRADADRQLADELSIQLAAERCNRHDPKP